VNLLRGHLLSRRLDQITGWGLKFLRAWDGTLTTLGDESIPFPVNKIIEGDAFSLKLMLTNN